MQMPPASRSWNAWGSERRSHSTLTFGNTASKLSVSPSEATGRWGQVALSDQNLIYGSAAIQEPSSIHCFRSSSMIPVPSKAAR